MTTYFGGVRNCGNCKWFLVMDENTGKGVCYTNPPTVMVGDISLRPTVFSNEECRHWIRRRKPSVPV